MHEKIDSFFEVVDKRRSIRKYTDRRVTEEELQKILEAGRQAPSGENAQPWRFIIVRNQESKDYLSTVGRNASGRRFTGEYLSKHMQTRFEDLKDDEKKIKAYKKLTSGLVSAFVNQPDICILVLGKKDVWDAPFDTSAAIQNMHLAATALGLGACWLVAPSIDIRDEKRINDYFGITQEYKMFAIVTIGEPDQSPGQRPRLPLSELTFSEKFGVPYYEKEDL
jgi:nitroreductase